MGAGAGCTQTSVTSDGDDSSSADVTPVKEPPSNGHAHALTIVDVLPVLPAHEEEEEEESRDENTSPPPPPPPELPPR